MRILQKFIKVTVVKELLNVGFLTDISNFPASRKFFISGMRVNYFLYA